ncbi:MAG: Zn-dependent hydrolase, partial [Eudoraea sp.]|nr:Zn-dependent hydrolase [Eudoraea sp.]
MLRLFIIILLAPLCIQPIKAQSKILVNQDRLESSLLELAEFGIKENGETNRVAFSDADIAARDFVIKLMREVGMDVSIDFAGNIVGTIAGKDPKKKPLAFGSHIDMV